MTESLRVELESLANGEIEDVRTCLRILIEAVQEIRQAVEAIESQTTAGAGR